MFTLAFLMYAALSIALGVWNWVILPSPWNLAAAFFGFMALLALKWAFEAAFIGPPKRK